MYEKYFSTFNTRECLEKYQKKKIEKLKKVWKSFPKEIIDKKSYIKSFDKYNLTKLTYEECLNFGKKQEKDRDFKGKLNNLSVGLSSGTSGTPGVFITNDVEQIKWAAIVIAKMIPISYIINSLFTFKKIKVTLILRNNNNLYESVNGLLINFKYIDLSKENNIYEKLLKFSPDILIAPATVLKSLAFKNKDNNLRPEIIISVAEVLEDKDFIEKAFKIKVKELYQATEGFLGYSCKENELHLNEKYVKIDKITYKDGYFNPVITDFSRKEQLIANYRLDDLIKLKENFVCNCGSNEYVIEKIAGRNDEVIIHNGQEIFPETIRQIFFSNKGLILNYEIEYEIIKKELIVYLESLEVIDIELISKSLKEVFSDVMLNINFKEYVKKDSGAKKIRIRNKK